ncbi:hypothetical protein Syun_013074 [Stephania yunnanensis]|uniref:Protein DETOXIFICATION n=1 Tax=Stephania yunnanensis TaxID=152371 RepID=A0AAP0K1C5_9MAGN
MSETLELEENPLEKVPSQPTGTATFSRKWATKLHQIIVSEFRLQKGISVPLMAMNLTWYLKLAITTAFLGRLGELQLAGGAFGFTFANVTGFSVLSGLCGAMEPICGQAHGAKNYRLLHKTLLMTILLLLVATIPITFLWLNVDRILIHFGQQREISTVAKDYLLYLLPDLIVTAFLCPLKSYLSSQAITVPIMLSSATALAVHVPLNILLSRWKGLQGVSMTVCLTDLIVVIMLTVYVLMSEARKGENWRGGWCDQGRSDWLRLVKLSGPCCLTTCLEWWCYEILVLLTGHLSEAKQAVAVLAVVLNFDYLLYAIMLSLATCASIRVSNELGAKQPIPSYQSAHFSLAISIICGVIGGSVMVAARGLWGSLYSHDIRVVKGVKKTMLLMAVIEVVNFPLAVCGGIVRGTARPWLAMYANIAGFYFLALPLGVVLAFRNGLRLTGLLLGFLIGMVSSLVLLLMFVLRIDWVKEAEKAQKLVNDTQRGNSDPTKEMVDNNNV